MSRVKYVDYHKKLIVWIDVTFNISMNYDISTLFCFASVAEKQ